MSLLATRLRFLNNSLSFDFNRCVAVSPAVAILAYVEMLVYKAKSMNHGDVQ
jgi:hypothetical protein